MVAASFVHFMILYQHIIGAITHCLSAGSLYIMVRKTPAAGKPFAKYLMLLQICITIVDFTFGFLVCPVLFFPTQAVICAGFLCNIGVSGHVGQTFIFLSMGWVAMSVVLCFHFKYESIVRLTGYRRIRIVETLLVRAFIFAIVTAPGIAYALCYTLLRDGTALISQYDPAEEWINNYEAISYSFKDSLPRSISLAGTTLFGMTAVTVISSAFIAHTFKLLSHSSAMSDRTRLLQRQLLILLLIQVSIPITIQICPLLFFAASIIGGIFNPVMNNVVLCVELSHAIVHTVVIIFTTPSYREAIIGRLMQNTSAVIVQSRISNTNSRDHR